MKINDKKPEPFAEGVCVAPVGLTLPRSQERLEEVEEDQRSKDPETIMMRLWAEVNTRKYGRNNGMVPIDSILHECTVECGKGLSILGKRVSHTYEEPDPEKVRIISATVQWLATNAGRAVLERFQRRLNATYGTGVVDEEE